MKKVLLFVKPFGKGDNEKGNPLTNEIVTSLYRLGCIANAVKSMQVTPEIVLKHYTELMETGREQIVYGMVGEYVNEDLGNKLKNGEKLTEEEMQVKGKTILVFDMNIPETFERNKAIRDDITPHTPELEEVEGTVENFRKYVVGPTKQLTYSQRLEKAFKEGPEYSSNKKAYEEMMDNVMDEYIAASNSIRAKYTYQGVGRVESFNVVHCSASDKEAQEEINNFFNVWKDQGTMLDVNKVNAHFENLAKTTEEVNQIELNARVENNEFDYFDAIEFAEDPTM